MEIGWGLHGVYSVNAELVGFLLGERGTGEWQRLD